MAVVFSIFSTPVDIVTDSAYVANLVSRLNKGVLTMSDNQLLFDVLLELWKSIQLQTEPYFIMHICSHTILPGFYTEGNARADALVSAMTLSTVPNIKQQAVSSHQFFHQGY